MYKISSFLPLLILGMCLQASDLNQGYMINNQGDTLYGYIKIYSSRNTPLKIGFTESADGDFVFYSPAMVKEFFRKDKKCYRSKTILRNGNRTTVFLEVHVTGKVNLYSNKFKNERYFFVQGSDTLVYELLDNDGVEMYNRSHLMKNNMDVHPGDMSHDRYRYFNVKRDVYIGTLKVMMYDASMDFIKKIDKTLLDKKILTKLIVDYHKDIGMEDGVVVYK